MKKIYDDIMKIIDTEIEIAKKLNLTGTKEEEAFKRGHLSGLENSKDVIKEVFCKLYFTKYEERKDKAWEKIKAKRKISPYYGYDKKLTCRHYELQAQRIKELLQNKEYYKAIDLYKKCVKELSAFGTKTLGEAHMVFLTTFEDREIEFLNNFIK